MIAELDCRASFSSPTPDPKSEKKNLVNQLIEKTWPNVMILKRETVPQKLGKKKNNKIKDNRKTQEPEDIVYNPDINHILDGITVIIVKNNYRHDLVNTFQTETISSQVD